MTSKTPSFNLAPHFNDFVQAQIGQGRYDNVSDVVQAGLRLLEEEEAKLTALRAALIEGEESGPSMPFDFDAFMQEMREADLSDK